jgi:hypothetical protein
MSLRVTSLRTIIRKSERRRNRREREQNSDFEVYNPYHNNECKKYFPKSIEKQLSSLRYLSKKNLENIDCKIIIPLDKMKIELDNMRNAAEQQ